MVVWLFTWGCLVVSITLGTLTHRRAQRTIDTLKRELQRQTTLAMAAMHALEQLGIAVQVQERDGRLAVSFLAEDLNAVQKAKATLLATGETRH